MSRQIIGLDLEMTGTDWTENKIIQVGLCLDPRDDAENFVSDVGWKKDEYLYNPKSLEVIKWEHERIWAGPPADEVEDALIEWCEAHGITKQGLIPVGYGVKAFDMPFIGNTWPRFSEYFIRPNNINSLYYNFTFRCCDLTDVTYGMIGAVPSNKDKKKYGFDGWKRAGKKYGEAELSMIGIEPNWHDAGYDARQAMMALEYFNKERGHESVSISN